MSGSLPHAIFSHATTNSPLSGSASSFDKRRDDENDQGSLNALNARASSDFVIHLSDEGQALSQQAQQESLQNNRSTSQGNEEDQENEKAVSPSLSVEKKLTPEEEKQLEELKRRDQEVRIHEQAHASVGGVQTGSPSYTYTQGPDGKRYITDGEVSIQVSASSQDPQQTISDMEQVYRAALAPAEPSAADRKAAAQAQMIIREARSELAKQQRTEAEQPDDKTSFQDNTSINSIPSNNKSNTYTEAPSHKGDFLNQIV